MIKENTEIANQTMKSISNQFYDFLPRSDFEQITNRNQICFNTQVQNLDDKIQGIQKNMQFMQLAKYSNQRAQST